MSTQTMRAAMVPSAEDHHLVMRDVAVPDPGPGHVRIKVEASGICHSDVVTIYNAYPGITFPRTPGHEIAGRIDALGLQVTGWRVGDRVGVGWCGGYDGTCDRCRRGDFNTCRNGEVPGVNYDGGHAEYVVVPTVALTRIPDKLTAEEAAPLMCAGITTFNALRHSPARIGDLVAILGIGGLGHLGVQFASKMGFRTVAIARGSDKEEFARSLGATHYIDSQASDVGAELEKLGGAQVVLSTVTAASAMEPVLNGLDVGGQLLVVGAASEPLSLNTAAMIGNRTSVKAWPAGTPADSADTLRFAVQTGVRAMIETLPLERAAEGFERMMSGKARFRVVLVP